MKTMLFNPYTGTPRHPDDIKSDPQGLLIAEPGEPLRPAHDHIHMISTFTPDVKTPSEPSPTAGMKMAQRILHVGGRNNAAGYVEFGSVQAVQALVQQFVRDAGLVPVEAYNRLNELNEINAARILALISSNEAKHHQLRDALAQALGSTYVCGRAWSAWQHGTMTADDFTPAAECDELLSELVAAVESIKE